MYISFQLQVFCNGFYSCSSVINIVLLEENYHRTIIVGHICEGIIHVCASFICDYIIMLIVLNQYILNLSIGENCEFYGSVNWY